MLSPMLFPNGTSSLGGQPYIEFGYWRATHRDERIVVVESESEFGKNVLSRLKTSNFAVKIGAEFKF